MGEEKRVRKTSLINRAAIKKFALEHASRSRAAAKFTRVSEGFIDDMEYYLARRIRAKIHEHPSVGCTLKA
jgi:hypothetical protein